MFGDRSGLYVISGGESVVGAGGCVGRSFGDVLGHVSGDGVIRQPFTIAEGTQRAGVELLSPAEGMLADGRAVWTVDHDAPSGSVYGGGERLGSCPGRGRGVGTRWPVQPHDGVHVEGRTALVLGDFGEGEPGMLGEAGLCNPGSRGQGPAHAACEARPQLARVGMPQDVTGVVVAIGAQWLTDERIGISMSGSAADGPPMFAMPGIAAGAATFRPSGDVVHGAEAGSGEGDEEPRVCANIGRHGLAADEPGAHQVEGVSRMEAGTGRADGRAPVAAADEEPFARFPAGVVVVQDLAAVSVTDGCCAREVDRVGAAAR